MVPSPSRGRGCSRAAVLRGDPAAASPCQEGTARVARAAPLASPEGEQMGFFSPRFECVGTGEFPTQRGQVKSFSCLVPDRIPKAPTNSYPEFGKPHRHPEILIKMSRSVQGCWYPRHPLSFPSQTPASERTLPSRFLCLKPNEKLLMHPTFLFCSSDLPDRL